MRSCPRHDHHRIIENLRSARHADGEGHTCRVWLNQSIYANGVGALVKREKKDRCSPAVWPRPFAECSAEWQVVRWRIQSFACQLYECRKSTTALAALLERISASQRECQSFVSSDGASNGWISTPSSMPSVGANLPIFHPACPRDAAMWDAALLASASGTNSIIARCPANGFKGSVLAFVLPIDQNGKTPVQPPPHPVVYSFVSMEPPTRSFVQKT